MALHREGDGDEEKKGGSDERASETEVFSDGRKGRSLIQKGKGLRKDQQKYQRLGETKPRGEGCAIKAGRQNGGVGSARDHTAMGGSATEKNSWQEFP